jgi:hypothetical protein
MRAFRVALAATLLLAGCDRRKEPEPLRASDLPEYAAEPTADFTGSYASNWGPAECNQVGAKVKCVYTSTPARMECDARGASLDCRWIERTARGHAKFKRIANGSLVGTWGYAQSADNRGAWMLTKK